MQFVKVNDEVVSVEMSVSDVGTIGSGLGRNPQDDREDSLARIFRTAHERLTATEDKVIEDVA